MLYQYSFDFHWRIYNCDEKMIFYLEICAFGFSYRIKFEQSSLLDGLSMEKFRFYLLSNMYDNFLRTKK